MIPLVKLNSAGFGYKSGISQNLILDKIDFAVSKGDFFVIEGRNGSGKSTLLKGLLGLVPLLQGSMQKSIRAQDFGYVPQELNFDLELPVSALDFVRYSSGFYISPERIDYYFQLVGLDQKKYEKIGSLSGGQRRRIILLRALVQEPQILLLDEPMANVDAESEKQIVKILNEINENKKIAVLISNHGYEWPSNRKKIYIANSKLHNFSPNSPETKKQQT